MRRGPGFLPGLRDGERRPRGVGESAALGGASLSDSVGADLLRGERIPRGTEWDLLCRNLSALRALRWCLCHWKTPPDIIWSPVVSVTMITLKLCSSQSLQFSKKQDVWCFVAYFTLNALLYDIYSAYSEAAEGWCARNRFIPLKTTFSAS